MVRLEQTMHLSCTDNNSVSKQTKTRFHDPRHLGVLSGASKIISEPTVRLVQTEQLCCVKHYLQMDRNELPLEPSHLAVPSGASKMISKLMVRLVRNVYVSCTDTKIVSKRTETRFHMTHAT
jgi:hypothetical protein